MYNTNLIIIIMSFIIATVAIYFLYSIILHKENSKSEEDKLQISTKNILEQVKILYNKKEFALVELLALKYLERVPGHIEVRKYLAKSYYEQNKINNAIKQAIIVLKKDKKQADMHVILGHAYELKKMVPKAIQEFEYALEIEPNNQEILKTIAELYHDNMQPYDSIQAYEKLIECLISKEEKADIQSIIADLNIEVNNYPDAFEALQARLEVFPHDITTNKKYIDLYIKIKNYTTALDQLKYLLEFNSDPKVLTWIYETMINIFIIQEEYDNAIDITYKLIDLPKTDKYKLKRDLADYHLKLNHVTTSIEILEELALLSQYEFEITIQLADSYLKLESFEKSLEKYNILKDKASSTELKILNQLICELYIAWANKYIKEGKYDMSFEMLNFATQYNVTNPEIYYYMGLSNIQIKNYTSSLENLSIAINYCKDKDKEKENLPKYLLLLAEAHNKLGNFFEEKKALTDLLNIDAQNAEALYRVGLMYSSQQEIKKAQEVLKKALVSNPSFLDAKYQLALLYELSNKDKAYELYLQILEQDPTHENARNALTELQSNNYI